ncbi:hypothetical protein JCM10213_007764, partial [Rhodosporidiobolus nylandii]
KGTPDGQPFAEEMVVYVDSDFAGDVDTRRSTTGAVLQIDGNTVATFSRRQPVIATSTFRAELYAIHTAYTELDHLSSILAPLRPVTNSPLLVRNDNLGAVQKLNSITFSEESKHMDVKSKFIREQMERGFVKVEWIPGAANLADLLTKPLPAKRARELAEKIGLVGWPDDGEKWGSR